MPDREPDTTFQLGDSVKYSRAFMRSIQDMTLGKLVGIIIELHLFRSGGSYAVVRWSAPGSKPSKILLTNLVDASVVEGNK